MNQFQGPPVSYPSPRSPVNSLNTVIKIRSSKQLSRNSSIRQLATGRQYLFQMNNQASIPYTDKVLFRNGSQIAEIDLKLLSNYPQYQHHVHTTTYNQSAPNQTSPQTLLIINLAYYPNLAQQGVPLVLKFYIASLTHNTELLSAMDPYIKVLVGQGNKQIQTAWTSKVIKKGGKNPNFNGQICSKIILRSLNDVVRVQVWDKDMKYDDHVGGIQFLAYELLNRYQRVQAPLTYSKNNKLADAGLIQMDIQAI